ncbi:rare lipoprotein A [Rodentibacter caecimuris]|uniref:Endolytic peptidoglycan transglycosylase RlpA n=1 Tax=Rodentibacter caecimuris TaxID=1796644 RepID=A0AAJ3N150_9PAST|nr:septal ring lytic transglycosylase RlpA family protein [Rodentibacter heylii]AOF53781.1 Rare lipoprotein A precursor [Pasteurellaceae bacterium NI1060]MCX2962230.1 septal ring lytic transglycosylase RlpA family protein [Rodentibacter heylii]OOF73394.1 rare lipoprotein A [Rodentibacter heylii]OOF75447.1 rare lipoprotein A [Rodentibacter heylii]OOF77725.1 rare lipoprotein A [Rodentibacter heylii]
MKFKMLVKATALMLITAFTVLPVQAQNDPLKQYGIKGANLTRTTSIKSPKSYTVNGKTYTTHNANSAKEYSKNGIASYYHSKFHGRRTSSGEPYNANLYTAAHKTLPLNSYALVTNLRNNRKTIVRINDRGPFSRERIIDLSYTAAKEIGLIARGVGQVKVEALHVAANGKISGAGTKTLAKHARTQAASERLAIANIEKKLVNRQNLSKERYKLKMLDFHSENQATAIVNRLALDNINSQVNHRDGRYEIHFGPIEDKQMITQLKMKLQKMASGNPLIVYTYKN